MVSGMNKISIQIYNFIFSMTQKLNQENAPFVEKKNLKNIYVKKINSMMKLSHEDLLQDNLEITNILKKKKIQKVKSENDKNPDKLYKNRISAKRARLRKKLYIRLLQNEVNKLKEIDQEGRRIEKESLQFLKMINHKQEIKEKVEDQVERYLSSENLTTHKHHEEQNSTARMDKIIQEICQISVCSSLKNIRELSSQISVQQILKNEQEGEKLQRVLKQLFLESEQVRKVFVDIMKVNQNVKSCIEGENMKDCDFLDNFQMHYNSSSQEKPEKDNINIDDFCNYYQKPSNLGVFINLSEAERILIQASTFRDVGGVDREEMI